MDLSWLINNFNAQYNDYIFSTASTYFWLYLLIQFFMAGTFYFFVVCQDIKFSFHKMLAYIFPAKVYFSRQFVNDFLISSIHFMFPFILLAFLDVYTDMLGPLIRNMLEASFGVIELEINGIVAGTILGLITLAALDLGQFLAHWLQHKVPVLWEFHKVHHSVTTLNPLTNDRSHPIDLVMIAQISGVLVAILNGTTDYLTNGGLGVYTFFGVDAAALMFLMFVECLQHTHIPISFGKLNRFFVSPAMHQLHHSTAKKHQDKNLSQVFTIWDKLAGTYMVPKLNEKIEFGLTNKCEDDFGKLRVIYFIPFVRAYQLMKNTR